MWQLQWMISLVPDSILLWVINIMLLAGITGIVAGWLGKWIPFYGQYAALLKPIGIVLVVVSVYFKGGYSTEMAWRDKVRVAQEKARIAEEESKEANKKLDEEVKKKQKVIKENTIVYRDRIKEVAVIMDKECKVVPEAIDIHNAAAKNRKLGENK
jgi:hypothetical protein